jgi:hypothetical protein
MANTNFKAALYAAAALLLPVVGYSQSLAEEMNGLHGILEQLYDEMMPLCSDMIGISQGIAGFAALFLYRLAGMAAPGQRRAH